MIGRQAELLAIGSLIMREDEVVLCRFEGPESAVRRVAEQAGIPFERIVEGSRSLNSNLSYRGQQT